MRLRRASAVVATAAVLLASGCSPGGHASPGVSTVNVASTACSQDVATGGSRDLARPLTSAVPGSPGMMLGALGGRWAFVSVNSTGDNSVAVMRLGHGSPQLTRVVSLPATMPDAFGMALTHDGRYLLVAGYSATAVFTVSALESGSGDALAGVLSDAETGQFAVAVSPDDQYAYVADESRASGGMSVFNLGLALRKGFSAPGVAVGIVPTPPQAVDIAVSPDGTLLYVTALGTDPTPCSYGQLLVIDASRADSGADHDAVLAHVPAGCNPARVALSPDGSTAWVTALASNLLLAFSTAGLRSDPAHALRAAVRVGSEPGGLLLADGGRLALVADSARYMPDAADPQSVTVVNTADALAHRPALAGTIPAGAFPRNLSYDQATGQVMVANFNSATVEVFPAPRA
ncbi:MAG TPA: YncE family protein [Streptosporangiaceae bacterium]|jgi:DNA-binding beta-propeller fold protein YncE